MPKRNTQIVSIDVGLQGGGLDEYSNKHHVVPGRFAALENVRHDKPGQVSRRFGVDADGTISGSPAISRLFGRGSNRLALTAQSGVAANKTPHLYYKSGSAWNDAGPFPYAADVAIDPCLPIAQDALSTVFATSVVCSGVIARAHVAAVDAASPYSSAYLTLFDLTTGDPITFTDSSRVVASVRLTTQTQCVQLFAFPGDDYIYVAYTENGSGIILRRYQISTKTLSATLTTITNARVATGQITGFDLMGFPADTGKHLYVLHNTTSATTLALTRIANTTWAQAQATFAYAGTLRCVALCVQKTTAAGSDVRVFWHDSTNGLQTRSYNRTTVAGVLGATVVDATTTTVEQMGAAEDTTHAYVCVQYTASATYSRFLEMWRVDTSGVAGYNGTCQGMGLGSKPAWRGSTVYIAGLRESALQAAVFLLALRLDTGSVVHFLPAGRALYPFGAGLLPTSGTGSRALPNSTWVSSTLLETMAVYTKRVNSLTSTTQYAIQDAAAAAQWSFDPAKISATEAQGGLILGAALPVFFDGVSAVEAGALWYPEIVSAISGGGGGTIAAGDYSVSVGAEWTDAEGYLHRSGISPATTVTCILNDAIFVTIETLTLTMRASSTSVVPVARQDIRLIVYISETNGTTRYRFLAPPANTPTAPTYAFSTGVPIDATAEIDPSTGAKPNFLPDASPVLVASSLRVYSADVNAPTQIRPWKSFLDGEAAAGAEIFQARHGLAGRPTALAVIDEKLVVSTASGLAYAVGDGPNETGEQNTLSAFQAVLGGDAGAVSQNCVAVTPVGVFFACASRGFWLLDRSMQVSYVGKGINAQALAKTWVRAIALPRQNEVRFLSTGGDIAVYHYERESWSYWPAEGSNDPTDIVAIGGAMYLIAGGVPWVESTSVYTLPSGNPVEPLVRTAPIALGGIQGFQRVRRILFRGDDDGNAIDHTMRVRVDYNGEGTFSESATIVSDDILVDGENWQFEYRPIRRRCQSMAVEIYGSGDDGTAEYFTLAHIALEVQTLSGGARLRKEKRV